MAEEMTEEKKEEIVERKEYKFKCGIKAYQEECTLAQDKELIGILKAIDITRIDNFKDFKMDLISTIIEKDILEKMFDVILIRTNSSDAYGWQNLRRSEVIEVIEDFFTLSPALMKWFGTGKSAQVSKPDSQ